MSLDILAELEKQSKQITELAEEHWQITCIGVTVLFGYVMYLLLW